MTSGRFSILNLTRLGTDITRMLKVLHTHIQRGLAAPDWLTGAAEYIRTYLRVRGWGGGAHELVDTKIGDQLRLQVAHRKVAVPVRDCSTSMPH